MSFVEDLFQFFPTFLCLADWGLGEGDQIREPYYDQFFFFCFDSCIYNPLHAARRAMAAAVPLPLRSSDGFF